ncbi:hypothetical protein ABKV19_016516 [Rosa sericea]
MTGGSSTVDTETVSVTSSPTSEVEGNPNQRLCSVVLNEFNYLPWSRAVTLALGGRSKLSFINGSLEAPDITSPTYETWLCKDQLVMSWLLNSMEPKLSELFSYSESAYHLWRSVYDMYGNQNNAARVFQLKKEIAGLQQGDKTFVQHLGSLKSMWNELNLYRPHTTDATTLLKRADEDKVFQMLASLGSEYEDLRSHLLMNSELPSFSSVCNTIQREEIRRKVMKVETKPSSSEARAFAVSQRYSGDKGYKGKRPDWKCSYCQGLGHLREKCWILHPELKPKFDKDYKSFSRDNKGSQRVAIASDHKHKANLARSPSAETSRSIDFSSNPAALLNEFAAYLQTKKGNSECEMLTDGNSTALLGKFAGFLADSDCVKSEEIPGPSYQEDDW